MKRLLVAVFACSFLLSACGGSSGASDPAATETTTAKPKPKKSKKAATDKASLAAIAAERRARRDAAELAAEQGGILVLGDHLSAAVDMSSDQGWVGLLRKRMAASARPLPVVNASLSSDTAKSGINRLAWQIGKYSPKVVVIALGARDLENDTPISALRASLETIIRTAKANDVKPVLVGVHAPLSSPAEYQADVEQMYAALAKQYQVPFVADISAPYKRAALLAPAMGEAALSPVAAQPAIMETVWPAVDQVVQSLPSQKKSAKGKKKND